MKPSIFRARWCRRSGPSVSGHPFRKMRRRRLSAVDYCICIEELARVDPGLALSVAAHNGLCSAHILMFGTEEQKRTFLVPLARGEKIGAWGLTESTSGSDAAGMRTVAVRADGWWVLNGSKAFTPHGRVGHVMVTLAVTDRAAGARGISAFIVEHGTPGMTAGRKEDKLGVRSSDTSEVLFENCRHSRRSAARRGGTRLRQHHAGSGCRADWNRRAVGRAGAGSLRSGAPLCAGAQAFEPISSFQAIQWRARGQRDANRRRSPAHMPRGVLKDAAPGRRSSRRWRSSMPARSRSGCRRLRPDPRPTVSSKTTGGKVLPRREAHHDRRRHGEIQRLVIARQC